MFGIGTPELILILVILVLLFGARKLPQLAKSIGDSVKELRSGLNGESNEKKDKNTAKKPSSDKKS
ncbi:MAG TPA: twin-arginine translocase TatA/TatE family subunit [Candidatus Saccharibacteria bacterium]|nr:twin-arginine translocase TatA/TatE family subunit [Candidatus Saccharibacteria bacterium]HRK93942.1 twin-arginine translocase TatA/TatE family subunit [Candidatus Saccharibacteria bacterium]